MKVDPTGQVEHPRTHQAEPCPASPADPAPKLAADDDPRAALAAWMTGPDNPYFARAAVNWAWAQLFGKGLADPADDLSRQPARPSRTCSTPSRGTSSSTSTTSSDLIRTIATSEAYGLSSATVPGNERDSRLFSHASPRPLTAHQMADALAQATAIPNRFGALGTRRAIEVLDPATPSILLDTFGRCPRDRRMLDRRDPPLSLRQSLMLIGGDAVESRVQDRRGYLASLLELKPSPEEVVENLYLRTLCRPPTAEEQSRWSRELAAAPDSRATRPRTSSGASLNSREFAFNH